ncbi:MAG TPA: hypothetical protein VKE72_06210, partial [Methylocella sp.]|nr:hypothetical protein [Methylocella sp.]
AKPQDFLPDPPKGHDPLQIKDGEKGIMRRASLQAPKSTCAQVSKHFLNRSKDANQSLFVGFHL